MHMERVELEKLELVRYYVFSAGLGNSHSGAGNVFFF